MNNAPASQPCRGAGWCTSFHQSCPGYTRNPKRCLTPDAFNSSFQNIPLCPGAASPEKGPFCGGFGIDLGTWPWGCSCPRSSSRSSPQPRVLRGCLELYSPVEGECFLLASSCSPQNWDPPGLGDGEGLGGTGLHWVVVGETEATSPLGPPGDCPQWREQPEKPQKMMFQPRKAFERAPGAHGVSLVTVPSGETGAGSSLAEPVRRLSTGDGCGHTLLTPHSGTLSSKNYPGTYPNHTSCRWWLRAPPGTSLLLAFGDVDLEPSERCARSSVLLTSPQASTAYGKRWCPGGN